MDGELEAIRDRAYEAHHSGSHEAEELYRVFLSHHKCGEVAANLVQFYEKGSLGAAKKHYIWSLKFYDWHPSLVMNASNCFLELQDIETCKQFIERALLKNRDSITIRFAYARYLIATKK